MDLLEALFLHLEDSDRLYCPPTGDMPLASLPEHSVQQPGRAEQPDVARMERRDRTTTLLLFLRQEEESNLLPGCRGGDKILDLVER